MGSVENLDVLFMNFLPLIGEAFLGHWGFHSTEGQGRIAETWSELR